MHECLSRLHNPAGEMHVLEDAIQWHNGRCASELAEAAQLSSLADETPEGRSI